MSLDRARYSDPEKGDDGKWYFHLQGKNGEIVLASEGYDTKTGAARGIIDAKAIAREADGLPKSISVTIEGQTGETHTIDVLGPIHTV